LGRLILKKKRKKMATPIIEDKYYKIGKLKKGSSPDFNVELQKDELALYGQTLISQGVDTFEDWVAEYSFNYFNPKSIIVLAEKDENGQYVVKAELSVPNKPEENYHEGLADDMYRYMPQQSNNDKQALKKQEAKYDEIIAIFKEQLAQKDIEISELKKELEKLRKEQSNGLSDNVFNRLALENEKKYFEFNLEQKNKEIEALRKSWEEERKAKEIALSDGVIQANKVMEGVNMALSNPIVQGVLSGLVNKFMPQQPQIQGQIQATGYPQQPQQHTGITDDDILNEPV
jgi:hypothetical protein